MTDYPIENKINDSIIDYCKSLESKVVVNGSILAKKLSSMVAVGLLSKQQKKIYDCLTEKPKNTFVLSLETKLPSIQVANQLRMINKTTQLVSFTKEAKKINKLWFKN